jgi:hypothetical protein
MQPKEDKSGRGIQQGCIAQFSGYLDIDDWNAR